MSLPTDNSAPTFDDVNVVNSIDAAISEQVVDTSEEQAVEKLLDRTYPKKNRQIRFRC